MKRELTASENMIIIEALKALMQDKKVLARNSKVSTTIYEIQYLEAQTLRNALLNKGVKLHIETP